MTPQKRPDDPNGGSVGRADEVLPQAQGEKVQQPVAQLPEGYPGLLEDIKARVRSSRVKAALAANSELVLLYWHVGRAILERQQEEGWGAKVIDHLSRDLRREFPDMRGFSPRNLKYMRSLAQAHTDGMIVQEVLAQITWYHNIALLEKTKDPAERLWYAHQTLQHGWSRNVLVHQIESDLYHRQGQAITNFDRTLPPPQSDLAQEALKDPYVFDFLSLTDGARERELHRALVQQIRDFLLELGVGFAFVGSQQHLEVGGEDFYVDLLFYHLHLRCYVVIDLKIGQFQPEHAGKMNFYLSAVDDLLRHAEDQPSIGLVLCKARNRVVAEYALRDMHKPMGVAAYRLLPDEIKASLPSPEQLEAELREGAGSDQCT